MKNSNKAIRILLLSINSANKATAVKRVLKSPNHLCLKNSSSRESASDSIDRSSHSALGTGSQTGKLTSLTCTSPGWPAAGTSAHLRTTGGGRWGTPWSHRLEARSLRSWPGPRPPGRGCDAQERRWRRRSLKARSGDTFARPEGSARRDTEPDSWPRSHLMRGNMN